MENSEEIKQSGLEFLKRLSIAEISGKTFIHEAELKRFLNGEFDGINKTKAMGFIQILQREYNIDLSDLKSRYISYLDEHKDDVPEHKPSMIMEEVQSEERRKGIFSFLFLIAAIGAMAYLVNKYDLLNFNKPNDIKTAEMLDSNEVKDVKLDLGKLSNPQKPEIVKEVKKEESVVASEAQTDGEQKDQELSLNDVLEPQKDVAQKESNEPQETTASEGQSANSDELDLSKLNSELEQQTAQVTADDNQSITSSTEDTQSDTNQQDAVATELYIIPNSKVWIGTINLETLKKKDFLAPRNKRVDIDATQNQLIMIGHKFIKIYLDGKQVRFKRKGPIRFKYVDGELIEINRREFNKLAKGRQW